MHKELQAPGVGERVGKWTDGGEMYGTVTKVDASRITISWDVVPGPVIEDLFDLTRLWWA